MLTRTLSISGNNWRKPKVHKKTNYKYKQMVPYFVPWKQRIEKYQHIQ